MKSIIPKSICAFLALAISACSGGSPSMPTLPTACGFLFARWWAGRTPHLDNLAAEGMIFTDYYAEASWATDKDDQTVDPRWGKVGKQTIKDEGTLYPDRSPEIE
jgi:hypothetical protein